MALHAPRPASVGGRLPANEAVDESGSLRVDGPRFALAVAPFEGQGFGAERGFVLLPRRWVVERDFAWASRFLRLAKDYERLPETVAGLHLVAFACIFLQQAVGIPSAGS